MELEKIKESWESISNRATENSNLITFKQQQQQRLSSSLKAITVSEVMGCIICLSGAIFVVFNFKNLDTNFLKGTGVLAIMLLAILPALSLISVYRLNKVGNVNKTYAETLKEFSLEKITFLKLQKLNGNICYLLLLTVIILISKLVMGKDISDDKFFWTFSFCFGYIFLLFFSTWVSKKYNHTIKKAEELLHELTEA